MKWNIYRRSIIVFESQRTMASNNFQSYTMDETLKMRIKFISIEGNIGSGKSTLVSMLKKYNDIIFKKMTRAQGVDDVPEIHFIDEPVDEWTTIQNEDGKSILECFYENQEKYSFTFQMTAYITRVKKIKEYIEKLKEERFKDLYERKDDVGLGGFMRNLQRQCKTYLIITERCLGTDRNVFAKMMRYQGKIDTLEWNSYNTWFDMFAKEYNVMDFIYVTTPPELCFERIKKRCREGEEGIPLEYLKQCDAYHKKWLMSNKEFEVFCFDGSKEANTSKPLDLKYINPVVSEICNAIL